MEEERLEKQKLKDKMLEDQKEQQLKKQKLEEEKLREKKQKDQLLEHQMLEVHMLEDQLGQEDIQVKVEAALPKPKENLLSSLMEDLVDEEQEFVYEPMQVEQPPIITICKPQIIQGDINNKQVIVSC